MSTSFTRVIRRVPNDIEVTVRRDCCASGCNAWKTWPPPRSYEGTVKQAEPILAFNYGISPDITTGRLSRRIEVTTL